jgi:hypothetical protein
VGFTQMQAALRVSLPTPSKFVLVCLAHHASELCGLARPGVWLLAAETGLSDRAVREALKILRARKDEHDRPEWLKIYRYPHGGRGVTTEYIVMPGVEKLSTAECGKCSSKGKTLHPVQGIE